MSQVGPAGQWLCSNGLLELGGTCHAGVTRCLAAKAGALKAIPGAMFEDSEDDDDDLDMLIIDISSADQQIIASSAAEQGKAFAWMDAVIGHLSENEGAKDSILMVLLMPEVRVEAARTTSQCLEHDDLSLLA